MSASNNNRFSRPAARRLIAARPGSPLRRLAEALLRGWAALAWPA